MTTRATGGDGREHQHQPTALFLSWRLHRIARVHTQEAVVPPNALPATRGTALVTVRSKRAPRLGLGRGIQCHRDVRRERNEVGHVRVPWALESTKNAQCRTGLRSRWTTVTARRYPDSACTRTTTTRNIAAFDCSHDQIRPSSCTFAFPPKAASTLTRRCTRISSHHSW